MEQRKITVVSTRDQVRKTFMSSAKTLGELKSEMTANGVDHEGLTYLEGLTKAEYIDDSSVLPLTVSYEDPGTGEEKITNELVFILTQPNKKIKSGAYTRSGAYERIKMLHLENEVKKVYGKNYTLVGTDALGKLIDEHIAEGLSATPSGRAICHKKASIESNTPDSGTFNPDTIESLQVQTANLKNQIEAIKKAISYICMRSDGLDDEDMEEIERTFAVNSPITSITQTTSTNKHYVESGLPKGILDNIIKELD